MSRLAYVCIGATGHIYPSLATMRQLVTMGHEVTYVVPERCRSLVEGFGTKWCGYESTILEHTPRRVDGFDGGDLPVHMARELEVALPSLESALRTLEPDVAIVDAFTVAGRLAARGLQLPTIRVDTSYILSPEYDYFEEIAAGRLRGSIATAAARSRFDEAMARLARQRGWSSETFSDLLQWRAPLDVAFVSRYLHPAVDAFGPTTHFVGSGSYGATHPATAISTNELLSDRRATRPLVYVSFGSVFTYQPAIYDICLELFGGRDVDLVVAIGPGFADATWLDVPPNARVCQFAPQLEILSHAHLFITHGGMGAVMEALSHGVPVIVIPQYPEQLVTALRCEELGVGLHLDRRKVSLDALADASDRVLAASSFAARSRDLAIAVQREGGYERAASLIDEFSQSVKSRRKPA